MFKRMLALLTALFLLFGCAAAETAAEPAAAARQIEVKTFPFYLFTNQNTWPEPFPLYFADGVHDLPYVDLNDFAKLLNWFYPTQIPDLFTGYRVTVEVNSEAGQVRYARENSFNCVFDFNERTIFWDDYMGFLMQTVGTYMDITSVPPTDSEGRPFLLSKVASRDRYGDITRLNLAEYDIPMIAQDGKYLIPLQTLSAFFFSLNHVGLYYNQNALFIAQISSMEDPQQALIKELANAGLMTQEMIRELQENPDEIEERMTRMLQQIASTPEGIVLIAQYQEDSETALYPLYASGPKSTRSWPLIDYGVKELCLELDSFYGLKQPHNISDFLTFFLQNGLMSKLEDPDAAIADSAIAELTQYWIDDSHSGFCGPSYLTEEDLTDQIDTGFDITKREQLGEIMGKFRGRHPEAKQSYYEIGNTAFVTFDEFKMEEGENSAMDYYALDESGQLPDDTVGLIIQAHRQITRENSPIENVVIDLSCNGGGAAPAGVFVLGWFLGNAEVSLQNSLTGAETTVVYRADVNLDRQFDENDTISHLNLFCLISPQSFSCGNLLPWAFKADGRVTLLGKVSGGGSCVVQPMTTAWGTSFQISGIKRLSFTKNGAFYDVDRGVEPDYIINSYDHFYDREALAGYINSLF